MHEPNLFRQAFALWERTASAYLGALSKNPFFLGSAGSSLNALFSAKKVADDAVTSFVSALGLATRADQERTLHLLHQIDGKLEDLQFELEQARRGSSEAGTPP